MKKCLFSLDAYVVLCSTWTKNLWQYLLSICLFMKYLSIRKIWIQQCINKWQCSSKNVSPHFEWPSSMSLTINFAGKIDASLFGGEGKYNLKCYFWNSNYSLVSYNNLTLFSLGFSLKGRKYFEVWISIKLHEKAIEIL